MNDEIEVTITRSRPTNKRAAQMVGERYGPNGSIAGTIYHGSI